MLIRSVRLLLPAALVVALLTAQPTVTPAAAAGGRIEGGDRYATAVAISQRQFPTGAPTAYIARAFVFADALAAGVLPDGPILLVPDGCEPLPQSVVGEIERLDPDEVVALGGPVAICDAQLAAAGAGREIDRVEGGDRYATSAAVARRAFPDTVETVYVASGADAPDAVAGGALTTGPILLLPPGGDVPRPVLEAIEAFDPERVVALGGTQAVTAAQLDAAADGRRTGRLAGGDRYATSVDIAEEAFEDAGIVPAVYLARGDVFADAVAAGSLTDGPIVLVPQCGELPQVVAEYLADTAPIEVVALGGRGAVCNDLLEAAVVAGGVTDVEELVLDGAPTRVELDDDETRTFAVDVPEAGWFGVSWQELRDAEDSGRAELFSPNGHRVDFDSTSGSNNAAGVSARATGPGRWFVVFDAPSGPWSPEVVATTFVTTGTAIDGEAVDTGPLARGRGQVVAVPARAGERFDVVLTDMRNAGGGPFITITVRGPDGRLVDPVDASIINSDRATDEITFDATTDGAWEVVLDPEGGELRTTTHLTRWDQATMTVDGPVLTKRDDRPGRGLDADITITEPTLLSFWARQIPDLDSCTSTELFDSLGDQLAFEPCSGGRILRLEPGEYRLLSSDEGVQKAVDTGLTSTSERTIELGESVSVASEGRRGSGLRVAFGATEGTTVDITVNVRDTIGDGTSSVNFDVFRPSGNSLRDGFRIVSGEDSFVIEDVELVDDGQHVVELDPQEHAFDFEVTVTAP